MTKNLKFHFLNVSNDGKGDCTIIEMPDGSITVIDIRNGRNDGTHQQQHENPIDYLKKITNSQLQRYIQTHPEMDHLDGFSDLLDTFGVHNFWDTKNTRSKPVEYYGEYREEDWDAYKNGKKELVHHFLRQNITIESTEGPYVYQIYPLSPTNELVEQANQSEKFNLLSYVIMISYKNCKILLGGDIETSVWEEIEMWMDSNPTTKELLSNVTVFKASHHGRDTSYCGNTFLKKINPRFIIADDNVPSDQSAYSKYEYFVQHREPNTGWIFSVGKETIIGEYVAGKSTTVDYKSKW